MNNPVISIIVPVYNSSSFLKTCFDSILNQTFKSYEVIIVNNSSTDNSQEIIDKYVERNSNFKAFFIEENSVSLARNKGIEEASGEYIAFVDSDDKIHKNYLEIMYCEIIRNNADVVECNYINHFLDRNHYYKNTFRKTKAGTYNGFEMCKNAIFDYNTRNYLWQRLWKKSIFTENNITFPVMFFEDIATVPRLFFFAKKVVVIPDSLYYYTRRKGSIMTSIDNQKIEDYVYSMGIIRNFLAVQRVKKKQSVKIMKRMYFMCKYANIYNLIWYCFKTKNLHNIFKLFKKMVGVLDYYKSPDYKVIDGIPDRIFYLK